jgi:hypothetical protein
MPNIEISFYIYRQTSIHMHTKTYSVLISLIVYFLFIGCDAPSHMGGDGSVKVANFSFVPEHTETPKSHNIAFVLINPSYAPSFYYRSYSPFSDFAKAMGNDVQQLIIARGFSIFGPYTTPDELIYSDKKNSDIILEIDIEPDINIQNVKATPHFKYGLYGTSTYVHTFDGTVIMQGKIDLTAKAVWNNEILWKKSIPLPTKSFEVNSYKKYVDNMFNRTFAANDAGVVNPFVDALEDYYKTVMQTVYAHLDPDEMKDVKKQADEIREKYNR